MRLHLLSNIPMKQKERWFASPLPKSVKFVVALQLTAQHYANSKYNIHRILMYLLGMDQEDLTEKQVRILTYYKASPEKVRLIKEFFCELYENENEICGYLNKEISKRYFRRNRKPGESDIDVVVRNIVNENLAELIDF